MLLGNSYSMYILGRKLASLDGCIGCLSFFRNRKRRCQCGTSKSDKGLRVHNCHLQTEIWQTGPIHDAQKLFKKEIIRYADLSGNSCLSVPAARRASLPTSSQRCFPLLGILSFSVAHIGGRCCVKVPRRELYIHALA